MSITRRQALASAGAAALASGLAKPAIAAKEPILIGYLAGAHRSLIVHRHRHQPRNPVGGEGDQRGRRHRRAAARADHPRHPERSDQGGERRGRAHARAEGERRLWPGQFRRVARGRAAARARQHAADASLLGRHPDRPEEISDVLPQRAHQPADRRRREPLRGRGAQAQEGRGDQRHHRLRHRIGQRLCADAQGHRRRGRLSGQRRRRQSGPQARAVAHAVGGRARRSCPGA